MRHPRWVCTCMYIGMRGKKEGTGQDRTGKPQPARSCPLLFYFVCTPLPLHYRHSHIHFLLVLVVLVVMLLGPLRSLPTYPRSSTKSCCAGRLLTPLALHTEPHRIRRQHHGGPPSGPSAHDGAEQAVRHAHRARALGGEGQGNGGCQRLVCRLLPFLLLGCCWLRLLWLLRLRGPAIRVAPPCRRRRGRHRSRCAPGRATHKAKSPVV